MSMSFFTDELAEVKTLKKDFLGQMNQLIPWSEWVAMIRPCYYKGERGNKPYGLELMLRIYVLQMVYNVADMAVAAEVIDSRAFSEFCGVTSSNQVPNGDTIGRFRNILIQNRLQEKLFADIVSRLKARGLMLMKGTIVDSTLIAAPSSTRNEKKARDPDAHQVKKGNQWYFSYKGHIAVDRDTGLVPSRGATVRVRVDHGRCTISTHAPLAGSDPFVRGGRFSRPDISTHAPLAGSDSAHYVASFFASISTHAQED